MLSAHALGFLEPSELNDPVRFRYEVRTNWGRMVQNVDVDIMIDLDEPEYYGIIGAAIWNGAIATAICATVNLELVWLYRWAATGAPFPTVPAGINRGRRIATPTGQAHSAIVMMCTGHSDNYGSRRLDLPNTPANWQSGGLLTDRGWDGLMQFAHGFKMGMAGSEIGGDLQHLIAYPGIVDPTIDNFSGTWLRKVTHLKVLQYTDKAPDWDGGVLG